MQYDELYDFLYKSGYHANGKNHGLQYVDIIHPAYAVKSLLEIGCSQGLVVSKFNELGIAAKGIDVSVEAIRQANALGNGNCQVASAHSLPFQDDEFESIFTCDVMEHLTEEDVVTAIVEMARVSTKYLFAKVAHNEEKNKGWINLVNKKKYNLQSLHLTIRPEGWWVERFEEQGWNLVKKENLNLLVFKRG